ncbi:hypothetical protein, partial [Stenotrophomonas maltophilia]|uniref:hypothetical protein n=1 Tax=Stenotrophomonas maltophilia TaxID=40324 RepID=UPI001955C892
PWGLDGAIHGANGPACVTRPPPDSFLRARNESEVQSQKNEQNQKPMPTKVGIYQKRGIGTETHRARG